MFFGRAVQGPFPYVGSDVDVLFGTREGFSSAVKKLREHNFVLLSQDLFTATMVRQDLRVKVDLQLEVTVSCLPYINKHLFLQNVVEREINGRTVITLNALAEVIVVACHAFYKEHMLTLADFYSIALSVAQNNSEELKELVERTKSRVAVTYLLMWTQRIANDVFGTRLSGVDNALSIVDQNTLEYKLGRTDIDLPFKLPKALVTLALINKIRGDEYTRSSLINALCYSFSRKQFRATLSHFSRESY
jgi:hypothetical protein